VNFSLGGLRRDLMRQEEIKKRDKKRTEETKERRENLRQKEKC